MWYETAVNNAQLRIVYSALYRYLKLTYQLRCSIPRRLHGRCNKIFTCSEQFVVECSVTLCCNPPYEEQKLLSKRNSYVTATWNSSDRSWRPRCSRHGELAQMVERPLSMREVPGSIPGFSNFFFLLITFFLYFSILAEVYQKNLWSKNFKILLLTAHVSGTISKRGQATAGNLKIAAMFSSLLINGTFHWHHTWRPFRRKAFFIPG